MERLDELPGAAKTAGRIFLQSKPHPDADTINRITAGGAISGLLCGKNPVDFLDYLDSLFSHPVDRGWIMGVSI